MRAMMPVVNRWYEPTGIRNSDSVESIKQRKQIKHIQEIKIILQEML